LSICRHIRVSVNPCLSVHSVAWQFIGIYHRGRGRSGRGLAERFVLAFFHIRIVYYTIWTVQLSCKEDIK
jgi:hypothetical protein